MSTDADAGIDTTDETPRRRRPRWVAYVCVIAGLVIVALVGLHFARSGDSKNARDGRPTAAVNTAKVVLADIPVEVDGIGTVTPIDTATIHTQESGVVFALPFTEGQIVRQGQVIAQIDPRPYRLALAQAQGTLAKDQAALVSARQDLARYETLGKLDSIARQTLDQQRQAVRQAEGQLIYDRAAVGTARLNLEYTAVKAPFSGRVGLRQVSVGSYVTPSDTNGLVVLTRSDPIDVQFSVPQGQLDAIRRRQGDTGPMPVTALDQNGQSVLAQGRFSTFDNQIDTTTGTVKAKARFANPGAQPVLFPNQFVNVRMLVDTLHQVPVVPVSALRHGAPGDFVFVVQPGSTVKLVVVKTGPSNNGKTAVLSGLHAGDVVVSEGADGLDDGSKVRLPGQHGAQSGAGGGSEGSGHRRRHQSQ
ncbi:efflux RND transporter periplasmic adaptor subunit [Novosphingobium sp. Leaf2]|uniref:efflux RND transporter periplasmic adaptor subunit n=1 Tax=Novosphingobium sp. Leaf2 TaxID=1735670 RepID=UPI0006F70AAD|nr:efflux RND transporter periplasmic adaptor subunit [Novosphingobium sp. Leaf2]KQM20391.1 hypothetical protein ASE49_16990 [Novosphingobium sp. Leaf2]